MAASEVLRDAQFPQLQQTHNAFLEVRERSPQFVDHKTRRINVGFIVVTTSLRCATSCPRGAFLLGRDVEFCTEPAREVELISPVEGRRFTGRNTEYHVLGLSPAFLFFSNHVIIELYISLIEQLKRRQSEVT